MYETLAGRLMVKLYNGKVQICWYRRWRLHSININQ
jgi:hypothetical protein